VSPLFIFSIENMDIKKFMREVITIYQGSTFKEALQIMTTKGCNSLLVVDNNEKLV
jgi:predicted transcriptional regulator